MNTYESFWISCKDGYQLSARYYASENNTKQFPILVCPATGITQNFYNSFAQWLNQQGYQIEIDKKTTLDGTIVHLTIQNK